MASVTANAPVYEESRSRSRFGSLKRTRRFYDVLASIVVLAVVTYAIGPIEARTSKNRRVRLSDPNRDRERDSS